jgi:suppressor of tumorigenicity protein 13
VGNWGFLKFTFFTQGAASASPVEKEDCDGEEEVDAELMPPEIEPPPMMPVGGAEDFEGAATHKERANELKASGDLVGAVDAFTSALSCQPSALTFANRAECLLKLKRPTAAVLDADAALAVNPDSAKALKVKGKALRFLGRWQDANTTLAKAMAIDFDPDMVEMVKFVEAKAKALNEKEARQRIQAQAAEKQRKVEAARKAAAERASATASSSGGGSGMPGMGGMPGMPGGMGGMPPGMGDLFSDPELMMAMQNPKVMAALQQAMGGNPAAIMTAMQDPEVGPILQKLMGKMGGMGMGGGMPGGGMGMPGMGGMGDFGGEAFDEGEENADDLPDLEDIPDLD